MHVNVLFLFYIDYSAILKKIIGLLEPDNRIYFMLLALLHNQWIHLVLNSNNFHSKLFLKHPCTKKKGKRNWKSNCLFGGYFISA